MPNEVRCPTVTLPPQLISGSLASVLIGVVVVRIMSIIVALMIAIGVYLQLIWGRLIISVSFGLRMNEVRGSEEVLCYVAASHMCISGPSHMLPTV